MSSSTTQFDLDRARDLVGRTNHPWFRRIVLVLMAGFVVAALAGAFGQSSSKRMIGGKAAHMSVELPSRVRGGLMWPAKIVVVANQKIAAPQIVLGSGFIRGMQFNSLEPAPVSETSRRSVGGGEPGRLALTYPTLEGGDTLTVYVQLQVNPTTVGRQDVSVSLEGAGIDPVRAPATLTVLP